MLQIIDMYINAIRAPQIRINKGLRHDDFDTAQYQVVAVGAGDVLALRDIGVEESEELPQILHALVDDGPAAAVGRGGEAREALTQAVCDATPALLQLQVRLPGVLARSDNFLSVQLFRPVCLSFLRRFHEPGVIVPSCNRISCAAFAAHVRVMQQR